MDMARYELRSITALRKEEINANIKRDVNTRIQAIMIAFGIDTQVELASIIDVSVSNVREWFRLKHLPRVPEMIILAEQTYVTLDWIYTGNSAGVDDEVASYLEGILSGKITADKKKGPLLLTKDDRSEFKPIRSKRAG